MYTWYDLAEPYEFIDSLSKNEELLVADLGNVIFNIADPIYQDPSLFVKTTYFTGGLVRLLNAVSSKLYEGKGNSVIKIQTKFGGGKTHALIALYHYLKVGENHFDFIKKPLPKEIRVVSIVGTHLNPLRGHKINNTIIKTLWGEMRDWVSTRWRKRI
jgi:predicted AAA+ superfamily ATPase